MKRFISIAALVLVVMTIGCRRSYLSDHEQSLLKHCKVDRSKSDLDDQVIEKVESLAYFVKSWNESGSKEEYRVFPWSDVALSMLKYPDKVVFANDTCDSCHKQSIVEVFFKSPSYTWEKLCGTAGTLTICTTCQKSISYNETMRN